ncbi:hypothetical protein PGT21_023897 [Puccinia graminis f. sp. tritici]|uniref:Uncharacterized protein n=1 Tax=Puccinia graminis f. sp. tritici TaxID=56615 RepID=A0A5B0P0T6_PUCGR|nr:hypothetical protein PGT21_023897 [Puccinia graminis f. sp. tritici]
MTVDPLQSISDSMSQSTQNPNPNQPNTNASIPIPPQTTTAAHPNTSTPIPKNPSSLIPSAPSKSNPHQKAAETRSQAQLNPGQIRKDSTSLPKGTASAPKVPKTVNILNTETGTTAVPEPAALKIKARTMLLAKAIKAQEDGDDDKADRFFEMHNILLKEETSVIAHSDKEIQVITEPTVVPQKRPTAAGGTTDSRGFKFKWGVSNSHDDGGFTPYFHKNILELKGPIPLTIFNRKWQEEALSFHSRNRPKTDETAAEKGLRYHGLPVPDEWTQSFADWTLNHRCFYETMRDRYNYPVLAEWTLIHKDHCDKLQRKHGFMVALRYDIRIRNNAFAFRVERDGKEFISDISDYKPDTADDAHSEARNFNEIGLRDNPYALGGPRYGWDPHTGQKINKPNAPQASSTKSAPLPSQPNPSPYSSSQSPSHPSQPPNHLPLKPGGQDQSQGRPPRGSGYKGKNYNPNHGSGFKKRD